MEIFGLKVSINSLTRWQDALKFFPKYSEVDYLLRQEYNNPMVYRSIIDVVANGASKLNEIATKINETTS